MAERIATLALSIRVADCVLEEARSLTEGGVLPSLPHHPWPASLPHITKTLTRPHRQGLAQARISLASTTTVKSRQSRLPNIADMDAIMPGFRFETTKPA